jgi:hypothetical protein
MHMTFFDTLEGIPVGATLHSITAVPTIETGHPALRVELTDEITEHGVFGVDYVDMPTFVMLPVEFRTGTIEVEVLARLNGKTTFDARGFAGLAFGIDPELTTFESIYVRVLNGLKMDPAPPRDRRAVQYFAYPGWPFDRLREEHPDGRYESGADIGPDEWNTLTVTVTEHTVVAEVNGAVVLTVSERKTDTRAGCVGLFVDIGTEAYFRDLRVTAD